MGSSISATTVQKTFKLEATSVYGEADIASGVSTKVSANGASKGIASITRTGTGLYKVTLDSSVPVRLFLGAPDFALSTASTAAHYQRITSLTTGSGASLVIQNYVAGVLTDLPDGKLYITLTVTTSAVY